MHKSDHLVLYHAVMAWRARWSVLRSVALLQFGLVAAAVGAVDLHQIFPSWQAWADEAARLEESIASFASLKAERFDDASSLLGALEVRDRVYRHARVVEGYVSLRLQLDATDAEARGRQQRLDEIDHAWRDGSRWFGRALEATGAAQVRRWSAPGGPVADYRHLLDQMLRGTEHRMPADPGFETAGRLRRHLVRAHELLATSELVAPEVGLSDGSTVTLTPATARTILWDTTDPADRTRIRKAWLESLGHFAGTFAELLAGVVLAERSAAEARGFDSALEASLFADAIPPEAVRNAIATARAGTEPLRRYHRLRRRALGTEHYGMADRFVPISSASASFTFEQARDLIVESAATLGPELQATVAMAFDQGWIDPEERPGKRVHGGATFVYRNHPYVLVNFRGNLDSLFQLAHEVGHAAHAFQADRSQPWVSAHYSSLTGEAVASLHEAVLVDLLVRRARSPAERGIVLELAIQNLLRLFFRPAIDADFELSLYETGGAVTREALGSGYLEAIRRYYGESLEFVESDRYGWMEPPHFFSSPLYMGRYPLASAAATALLERLTGGNDDDRAAARSDLLTLVRSGASDDPINLLRAAGADLSGQRTAAAVVERMDHLVKTLGDTIGRASGSAGANEALAPAVPPSLAGVGRSCPARAASVTE